MAVDHVAKVPWYFAGVIAIGSVGGWIWVGDTFADEKELAAKAKELTEQHVAIYGKLESNYTKTQQVLKSMQLEQAQNAVRYWEGRPSFPNLSTTDRMMYEDKLSKVIHYRQQLLELGTP